ncbi:MAG: Uma2 family endonuclease, partial [Microcystis aeruginosa G13-12]|nr:Uma2 family endonuclease [Microcystis aeruginosa SX13-11]NCR43451.1 Uma2 family endonuclease [Microcystis aeruginosa SX13-01]NCS15512.1 Uma2 family endonuclease [Microcystis aeruginosa G13-12]NCT63341.1 Uma2 family endonuclease [Microcystis aeruginosa G13-01]
MTLISSKSLTLPEFLSLPDGDITYELVDGEAIPKMSPKFFHSRLTGALFLVLDRWNQGRGEVGIEWAIVLSKNDRDWCPVPDLLYISP